VFPVKTFHSVLWQYKNTNRSILHIPVIVTGFQGRRGKCGNREGRVGFLVPRNEREKNSVPAANSIGKN
jgi:hypothetical protein